MEQTQQPIEKLMEIQSQIKRYDSLICGSWDAVLEGEVSKYPIVIFSTLPIEAGVLLIDRANAPGPWSVSISTLEEFHVKKLILDDKLEAFRKVYKDPSLYYCAFVISDLGAQFLFVPRA